MKQFFHKFKNIVLIKSNLFVLVKTNWNIMGLMIRSLKIIVTKLKKSKILKYII